MVAIGESLCSQWLHNTGNEEGGRDEGTQAAFWRQDCIASHPHPGLPLPGFRLWPVQEDGAVGNPDAVHQGVSSAGAPSGTPLPPTPRCFWRVTRAQGPNTTCTGEQEAGAPGHIPSKQLVVTILPGPGCRGQDRGDVWPRPAHMGRRRRSAAGLRPERLCLGFCGPWGPSGWMLEEVTRGTLALPAASGL